jgi:hypothetical protein
MADTNVLQFLRFIVASGVESTLNSQRLFIFSFLLCASRDFTASKTISSSSFFMQAMSLGQPLSEWATGVLLWQMTWRDDA